jgi:hypothetical protein
MTEISPGVTQMPDGSYRYHQETTSGWVVFAGCMLILIGMLNAIDGIAAVSNSNFFAKDAHFLVSNLHTYGWVLIGFAVVQGLTGLAIMMEIGGARWLGVAFAGLNAVVQLTFITTAPFFSLAVFTLDVLVVYGLVVHAKHRWYEQ